MVDSTTESKRWYKCEAREKESKKKRRTIHFALDPLLFVGVSIQLLFGA